MTYLFLVALLWATTLLAVPGHVIRRGRKPAIRVRVARLVPVDRYGAVVFRHTPKRRTANPRNAGSNTGTPVEELSPTPPTGGNKLARPLMDAPVREWYRYAAACRDRYGRDHSETRFAWRHADWAGKQAARRRAADASPERDEVKAAARRRRRIRVKTRKATAGFRGRLETTGAETARVAAERRSTWVEPTPAPTNTPTLTRKNRVILSATERWVIFDDDSVYKAEVRDFARRNAGSGQSFLWLARRRAREVLAQKWVEDFIVKSLNGDFWARKEKSILSRCLRDGTPLPEGLFIAIHRPAAVDTATVARKKTAVLAERLCA